MDNTTPIDDLKDSKAVRRDQKKKPRIRQHGRSLKKFTERTGSHIVNAERKKKK